MSDSLITIVAVTPSGDQQQFRCQRIVSIDGEPYSSKSDVEIKFEELLAYLNNMEGRVGSLEQLLGSMFSQPQFDTHSIPFGPHDIDSDSAGAINNG